MADEFILGLGESYDDVENLNKALNKTLDLLEQASKKGKGFRLADSVKSYKDYEKTARTSIKNVKKEYSGLQNQINNMAKNQNGLESVTKKQVAYEKSMKRAFDRQKELSRSYVQLNKRRAEAKKHLQDLITSEKASNREIRKAQKEFNTLNNRVNKANKAVSNFNKTGLGGAVRGFRNLVGAFGIYGGIQMFADFTRSTIDTIKSLDQLSYTLEQVIRNEGELARTRAYINELSLKYGAELLSTTNRYVKFNVAARNAGLELKTTERIFETVTEASALLGLKTDELTGIYLALEQMLSKGKVTTEELRRQLGERLPGAFDLMAKALGVTTIELDKMLRKGEVLSKEALPLLTEEIREFYNLSGEGVNTLQTATQKLSSSWSLLIESMNNSTAVGGLWQNILEGLASGIQNVSDSIKGVVSLEEENSYAEYFKKLSDEADNSINPIERIIQLRKEQSEIEDKFIVGQEELMRLRKWDIGFKNEETEAMEKTVGTLRGQYKAIEAYIKAIKDKNKADTEAKANLINKIELYKLDNKITNEKYDLSKLEKMSIEELNDVYSQLLEMKKGVITETEKEVAILGAGAKFWKAYGQAIKDVDEAIKDYTGDMLEQNIVLDESTQKRIKDAEATEKQREKLKELKSALDGFRRGFQDEFFSEAGLDFIGQFALDFDEMKEMIEAGGNQWEDYFNSISEMAQEAFNFLNQNQTSHFEREFDLLEDQKERSLRFAGDSAAARERIEEQYEARRKNILRRQAKAQKEAAIVNTVINTAQAVAATFASAGGFPLGLPLASIMAAIGATQVALIASQKIPEFREGVRDFDGGLAVVGDGGVNEFVRTPGGDVFKTPSTDTLVNLPKGSDVFKNEDDFLKELTKITDFNGILFDKGMFDLSSLKPSVNIDQNGVTANEMDKVMGKYFNNIQTNNTVLDKDGFSTFIKNGNSKTNILNNRVTFKGFDV